MPEEPQGVRPILGPQFPPAQPAQPPAPSEPPKKRVWAWALLGVAALLGVVVIGAPLLRESARRATCKHTLRSIGLVCHLYGDENNQVFPGSWQQLYPAYVDNALLFSCPSKPSACQDFAAGRGTEASSNYILLPGRWATLPGDFFLAYEKVENHKQGFHVLCVDARVEWWPASREAEFRAKLADQEAKFPALRRR
jgi:hypothetical protein